MFERLGSWTYRFRFLIVIAWVIAGVFMGLFAPSLAGAGSTDQTSFLPDGAPSKAAQEALERAFPGSTSASSATITFHRAGGLTGRGPRVSRRVRRVGDERRGTGRAARRRHRDRDRRLPPRARDAAPERGRRVRDPPDQPRRRRRGRHQATAVVEQLREHLAATTPAGLETHVTGAAAISSDYLEAVKVGTDSTTIVTIMLVLVVLLAIYRAPLAALIPLITIGGAYVVSTRRPRLPRRGRLAGLLDPRHVPRRDGVRRRDRLRDLPDQPLPRGGLERRRLARCRADHRAAGSARSSPPAPATVIVGMLAMGVGDFKMIASMGPRHRDRGRVTLVAGLTLARRCSRSSATTCSGRSTPGKPPRASPRGFFASLASAVSRRPAWSPSP